MLRLTLEADDEISDVMRNDPDDLDLAVSHRPSARRIVSGSLSGLSGAGGWMYAEYDDARASSSSSSSTSTSSSSLAR